MFSLFFFLMALSFSDPMKSGFLVLISLFWLGLSLSSFLGLLMILLLVLLYVSGIFLVLVYCTSLNLEKKNNFSSVIFIFFIMLSLKINFFGGFNFFNLLLIVNFFNLLLILFFLFLLLFFFNLFLNFLGAFRSF